MAARQISGPVPEQLFVGRDTAAQLLDVSTRTIDDAIRAGELKAVRVGKLSLFDFGLYVFLIMSADWKTGVYSGCALTIAFLVGEPRLKTKIQKALRHLRDKQYINYPIGKGARGRYPILIHKYHVTVGELSGKRLNAWKNGELVKPVYEAWNCVERFENCRRTVRELWRNLI